MTVQNKVEAVVSAKNLVTGVITDDGVEAVIADFITKYQEAIEVADGNAEIAESYAEVNTHLLAMRLPTLEKRI